MPDKPDRSTVVVFPGGDPPPASVLAHLDAGAFVIAADSGLDHALSLRCHVDMVVGDFDSVSPAALDAAVAARAVVERHPTEKDQTDLELALSAAVAHGATHLTVVGGGGGRLDHFLANALLLASPALASVQVEALVGTARLTVVRQPTSLHGHPRELVTLLALGATAHGVRTEGLRYPLVGDTLEPGSTRGVSNEFRGELACVALDDGVILAVQPYALSPS